MAGVQQGEKQLFEKFWRGTFKAVATPRPESIIVASITARKPLPRAIHPVSLCQLVPRTEPSPWAATAQHPPEHQALILCHHRGVFQQGSSSVPI